MILSQFFPLHPGVVVGLLFLRELQQIDQRWFPRCMAQWVFSEHEHLEEQFATSKDMYW